MQFASIIKIRLSTEGHSRQRHKSICRVELDISYCDYKYQEYLMDHLHMLLLVY